MEINVAKKKEKVRKVNREVLVYPEQVVVPEEGPVPAKAGTLPLKASTSPAMIVPDGLLAKLLPERLPMQSAAQKLINYSSLKHYKSHVNLALPPHKPPA